VTQVAQIRAVAEKHGLSLSQYLVLEVVARSDGLSLTIEAAATMAGKLLAETGLGDMDYHAAVFQCLKKGWIKVLSPDQAAKLRLARHHIDTLEVSSTGALVAQQIATEMNPGQ
jgi:hypothetical protein